MGLAAQESDNSTISIDATFLKAQADAEDMGELDNTLIFYIAGDNGTSAEGGMNGLYNEYTYFNGIEKEDVPVPFSSKSPIFLILNLSEFSNKETKPLTQYSEPFLSIPIPSPVIKPSIMLPARFFLDGEVLFATTTVFTSWDKVISAGLCIETKTEEVVQDEIKKIKNTIKKYWAFIELN